MCTPQRVENADGLPRPHRRGQEGIVLLLALIALLLISAVAASILFMASGESSLVGRQRTSTQVLYAGIAGLEEARMRLNSTDPNYLCAALPAGSCDVQNNLIFPVAVNQVVYVFNPANAAEAAVLQPNVCAGGVQVDALGNETCPTNIYYDWEYQREFGTSITNAAVVIRTVQSEQVAARAANPPWPVVTDKWTRVTIKTEAAARQDINGDGLYDNATPVFFDNDLMRQIVNVNCPGAACPEGARQVYRLPRAQRPDHRAAAQFLHHPCTD